MGMNGSAVQSVQYMLMDTGYLAGGADGIFGSATEDAVKRFQADYGLDVDALSVRRPWRLFQKPVDAKPLPKKGLAPTSGVS